MATFEARVDILKGINKIQTNISISTFKIIDDLLFEEVDRLYYKACGTSIWARVVREAVEWKRFELNGH